MIVSVVSFFAYKQIATNKLIGSYTDSIIEFPENFYELPVYMQDAAYAFDPDDKYLMSGFSDYIVIAYLNEIKGTVYQNVRMDERDLKGTPYTCYEMRIVRNIKGSLRTDCDIPVLQYGGVTIDGKSIECITGLLDDNKSYVLYLSSAADENIYLNKAYEVPGAETIDGCQKAVAENDGFLLEFYDAFSNEKKDFAPNTHYSTPYEEG